MVNNKYTIILDTNILGNYKKGHLNVSNFKYVEIDKDIFESLIKFIKDNNLLNEVEIAFSRISIEEIKYHQNELFEEKKKKLVRLIEELSSIGESKTNLEELDYDEYLSNKVTAFTGKYALRVIEYPPESCLKKLVEKVLKHQRPFYKNNKTDSGFKDALIWESIIHYAKKNPEREYIFLTKDPDFSNNLIEEFKSETDSNIIIKSSLLDIKKFLDEKINLKIKFDKMSKIYIDNFNIIENEVNNKFKVIFVEGNDFDIDRISLDKNLFDLEFNEEEYCLTVTGNILYSGMVFGFDYNTGNVDWHLKQDVEPDLFHIFLKKKEDSYKITSIKNTVSGLK